MTKPNKKRFLSKFIALQLLTFSRLPLSMTFAAIITLNEHANFILFLALFFLVLNEVTDLLDGYFARRYDIVTEWGSIIDPYADAVSRVIIYWSFAVSGLIHPLVPLVMVVRDASVAYSRIVLTRCNKSVAAKRSGKIKAIVQGTAAYFALLGPIYWPWVGNWTITVLSWIVGVATAASVIEYATAAVRAAVEKTRLSAEVQEKDGN